MYVLCIKNLSIICGIIIHVLNEGRCAVWLSLATDAVVATAALTSGETGVVSQVVAQPLSELPQALSLGDGGGEFCPSVFAHVHIGPPRSALHSLPYMAILPIDSDLFYRANLSAHV